MRWLLTGDAFNAEQARQPGLVQEIVAPGQALERAVEIAQRIAAQAPLGAAATLTSARLAQQDPEAAASTIYDEVRALMGTEDARAAVTAFVKRETPVFTGR